MVPNMWHLLRDDDLSHAYANFRIAAGLQAGRHRGPRWHDGDFYKWLEAAASVYALTGDAETGALMDEVIGVIGKAQRPDGYLHTPVIIARDRRGEDARPFQDPEGFEVYNFGHLMTAACTHYRASGKTDLLDIAMRAGDCLCSVFSRPAPEQASHSVCPAHYMGLVDMYRTTGDRKYLDLLQSLVAMRDLVQGGTDDNQTRVPLREQHRAAGHAVRANYLYAGVAGLCAETGDSELFDMLARVWEDVAYGKMYITGACGALCDGASPDGARDQKTISRVHQAYGRAYQLPNLTAYGETCANVGHVLWNWRMLQMTGEARYADVMETVLYNSGLAGISLDGKRFFYTNALRRERNLPFELRWSRTREPYIGCFCCPPNIVRTIAMASRWAYARSEEGLWAILYGSNRLDTELPDGSKLGVTQETDYPWDGRIALTLDVPAPSAFAIRLRIPGWAENATVAVNGQRVFSDPEPGGFVCLDRTWRTGDRVDLDLPMRPVLMEAHPLVEEDRNQVAVKRGPVVYCLESVDLPDGVRPADVVVPSDIALSPRYDDGLLDGVVALEGKAKAVETADRSGPLYRPRRVRSTREIDIRLIPYYAWDNRGLSDMAVWMPVGM